MTPSTGPSPGDPPAGALEAAEAAALRTIYTGLPDGRVVHLDGWTVRTWPRRPESPWMHQAFARGPVSGASLDAALAELVDLSVNVQVPDGALDEDELRARGFSAPVRLLRLVAPADGPDPVSDVGTSLVLESVGPPGGGDVSAVARAGFGFDEPWWWVAPLGADGWTQLVAYDGDEPVATAALHVAAGGAGGQAADVAWAGVACTVPGARGRGAQTALLAHRRRLAAELGARAVTSKVTPGSTSHRNLLRAGFSPAYEVVQWSRAAVSRAGPAEGGSPAPT